MVHGDLKPENILIFDDQVNGDLAKVVDFGYSGLSPDRLEDSKFQLPISEPWNAPEVHEWSSKFILDDARKTDVFSFGLICLWILFYNRFLTFHAENTAPPNDLDCIKILRDRDLLYSFAMQCIEDTEGLADNEIEGLALLFGWTLATDPRTRRLPHDAQEAATSILSQQKNMKATASDVENETRKLNLGALSSLGIQWKDIEGHARPFGFSPCVSNMFVRLTTL